MSVLVSLSLGVVGGEESSITFVVVPLFSLVLETSVKLFRAWGMVVEVTGVLLPPETNKFLFVLIN